MNTEEALIKAVHLIDGLAEGTECSLDHNGNCQEHLSFGEGVPMSKHLSS